METIRRTVRPKHQVLILKCFPRLPKNSSSAEIKPNGSELSYLLYYASSRRSKLSKVGAFLEKKTAHDLYKGRTSSVQITLQILTAFLDNPAMGGAGPQSIDLFAPYILRILRDVLKEATEAVVVESAVPTWDTLCRHQDHVALNADAEYRNLFASIVSLWAEYATKEQTQQAKGTERRGRMRVGVADNVKLRTAGLLALKSIADSDTLVTEAGRQLDTFVPVILQNLYYGESTLNQIMELNNEMATQEKDKAGKARPSLAVNRDHVSEDGDVRAAGGTTAEADRLADQEASLLALRCLKSIFTFENRGQIRAATNCVLRFALNNPPKALKSDQAAIQDEWAVQLFRTICTWTPVQDRFVAIFTAVEMLISSPVTEDELYRQLLLTRMISRILASDINLIGLSVMDVLLGLIQHLLKIVQSSDTADPRNGSNNTLIVSDSHQGSPDGARKNSTVRTQLLSQLQSCVSNLAVHVYYTDQISDMIVTIMLRLLPSTPPLVNRPLSRAASNQPAGSEGTTSPRQSDTALTNSSNPRPNGTRPMAAGFYFNSPLKREFALNAITNILQCANKPSSHEESYVAANRNPVPLHVWEGTQWLLRDPEHGVRAAYIRAFQVWLKYEFPQLGLDKGVDDEARAEKERKRKSLNSELARRAASTASAKKAATRRIQTVVLQTIHLEVVDAIAALDKDGVLPFQAGPTTTVTSTEGVEVPADTLADPEPHETPSSPNTDACRTDLINMDRELSQLSHTLRLPALDDFRATAIPAVPNPPSPKNSTLAFDADDSDTRHASSARSLTDLRSPSLSKSSNGNNNVVSRSASVGNSADPPAMHAAHTISLPKRQTSKSPSHNGGGAAGKIPPTSARHDFATTTPSPARSSNARGPPSAQVEDLKRLLTDPATARLRSRSADKHSRRADSPAHHHHPAPPTARGSAPALLARAEDAKCADDDSASESMVEIEGSWAATSFASQDRRGVGGGGGGRADVRALLRGMRTEGNGVDGGGLGAPPA